MKAVEDLTTEDFIQSASVNQELLLDRSTLVKIEPGQQRDQDHVALTFSVGKDKLTVRHSNAIITFPANSTGLSDRGKELNSECRLHFIRDGFKNASSVN